MRISDLAGVHLLNREWTTCESRDNEEGLWTKRLRRDTSEFVSQARLAISHSTGNYNKVVPDRTGWEVVGQSEK